MLPTYYRTESRVPGKGPQIDIAGASNAAHRAGMAEAAAVGDFARAGMDLANIFFQEGQEKIHAKRVDDLSNFQTATISAIAAHRDALRDNSDPETYQESLKTTFDKLQDELLPTLTDRKTNRLAVNYLNEERAREAANTEEIADAVRKDNRRANLQTNLTEMIRTGRPDRIEPLIAAARAANTIDATTAESLKEHYIKIAQEENYKNLKDATLTQAIEMGEAGKNWLLTPKNTPYLKNQDRQDLHQSLKTMLTNNQNAEEEKKKKQKETDMDLISKGQLDIDKSSLNETEQGTWRDRDYTESQRRLTKAQGDSKTQLLRSLNNKKLTQEEYNKTVGNSPLTAEDKIAAKKWFTEARTIQTDDNIKNSFDLEINKAADTKTLDEIHTRIDAQLGKKLKSDARDELIKKIDNKRENISAVQELEILRKIDLGQDITTTEIYDSVDKGLDSAKPSELVDRLKKREESIFNNEVHQRAVTFLSLGRENPVKWLETQNEYDKWFTEFATKNGRIPTPRESEDYLKFLITPITLGGWPWTGREKLKEQLGGELEQLPPEGKQAFVEASGNGVDTDDFLVEWRAEKKTLTTGTALHYFEIAGGDRQEVQRLLKRDGYLE